MKLDDDVKMISAEVPILFAKAAELFIQELTIHSWLQTEESRRRTLQRNDVAAAIAKNELYDFLIDIVPREEATKTHKKKENVSEVQYIVTLPSSSTLTNAIQLPSSSNFFLFPNVFFRIFRWTNYSITIESLVQCRHSFGKNRFCPFLFLQTNFDFRRVNRHNNNNTRLVRKIRTFSFLFFSVNTFH